MDNGEMVRARIIWERAIDIVPECDKLWYKCKYMEEMLRNIPECRQVFERWMALKPNEAPLRSYIKFELCHREVDKARNIYERFVKVLPNAETWMAYALFEEQHGNNTMSGNVYQRAEECGNIEKTRFDHVRVLYEHALTMVPTDEVLKNYQIFKANFGDRRGIADVTDRNRRSQYEEEVKRNPYDYDKWLAFLHLQDSDVDPQTIAPEKPVAGVSPIPRTTSAAAAERAGCDLVGPEPWHPCYTRYMCASALKTPKPGSSLQSCRSAWDGTRNLHGRHQLAETQYARCKVVRRKRLRAEDGSEVGWKEYHHQHFPEDAAYGPDDHQPQA